MKPILQVTICSAADIQQTNFMTRHNLDQKKEAKSELDPYVAIDVDEVFVERTSTKQRTRWEGALSYSAPEAGF